MENDTRIESIKNAIASHPDFPKKGIIFRDLFPILRKPKLFEDLISLLCEHIQNLHPDVEGVIGLDARGFLLAPIVALRLRVPFIPIRKSGKLPGKVHQASYSLEYGKDSLQMQAEAVTQGQKIVIVDDLLATGGTMRAAVTLAQEAGASVMECIVVMELEELNGKSQLTAPFFSLFKF